MTLWRPLATLGDTFASTPASKNRFRNIPTRNRATRASGFGVPLPLPAPQTREKKKNSEKSSEPAPLPSPYRLEIDGSDRKKYRSVLKSFPKSPQEFRRATKPLGDLELSPGRRSSRSLKRALVRLLQPDPHRAPKVNQSNQTSLHRYLPWPIISTLTS